MKILLIRFSSIGDIVLTTPVVRCLKKQLNAEVHYLTKKAYYSMLSQNPYIDKVHLYGGEMSRTVNKLKQENYDLIIDLHNNIRTLRIKWQLGKKAYSFKKLNIEKWLLVNFKIDRLPDVHVVDRYMDTCTPLGVVNDGEGLDYYIQDKDEVDITKFPEAFHNGYLAWVIGSKQRTKQFPDEKIVHILLSTDMPVVIVGGKEDKKDGKAISLGLHKRANVLNTCGEYTLNESASIVRQAKLVIANDTGLMHIAAAFKKKLISIWGSTVPQFGMTPYFGNHNVPNRIIESAEDIPCRPCSKIGHDHCPKGHFDCMKKISDHGLTKDIKYMYEHD